MDNIPQKPQKPLRGTRIPRQCEVCGVQFFLPPYRLKAPGSGRYCGAKCATVGRGRTNQKRSIYQCLRCGVSFEAKTCDARRYCSNKCRAAAGTIPKITILCAYCGNSFEHYPHAPRRYCGHRCADTASRTPIEERFWPKVQKGERCWLWQGEKTLQGYGRIHGGEGRARATLAHRLSWEIHHGPIPEDAWVLHHCDTPACVRPDHLFLGHQPANVADMVSKGRQSTAHGSRNANAKMTEETVGEMRTRFAAGGISASQLSREYGITTGCASAILLRRTWKHVF